ncbi:MAG: hypothetical protein OEV00_10205 [Acidobacteriota bacterium]|nr:hypothetical protein [Acidobacteriota bacterium]MDH3785682.1 hypothetical protein [Acidobacteriota bacterium]
MSRVTLLILACLLLVTPIVADGKNIGGGRTYTDSKTNPRAFTLAVDLDR